ncbi:MAG: hypothetical protein U0802_06400 [Candidatus Binatia bacterium]
MAAGSCSACTCWSSAAGAWGWAVIGAMALSIGLIVVARDLIPPDLLEPASPPFTYDGRPVALYDEAAWCGSRHTENYAEWRRSHGHAMDMPVHRSDLAHRTDSQGVDLALVGKARQRPDRRSCASCRRRPTSARCVTRRRPSSAPTRACRWKVRACRRATA